MNIAIYMGVLQDKTLGGGYTFEYTFLKELLNVKSSHKFFVYYISNSEIEFMDNEFVKFRKFDSLKTHDKILCFKIRRKQKLLKQHFSEDNIDVVYYISPMYVHVDYPSFVTIWDFGHKDIPYFPEVSANGTFEARENVYCESINKATRVIVSNSCAVNKVSVYYNISADKIVTNTLPTPEYIYNTTQDESILNKYNLLNNKYIYYPAQFWAHKNHIRIIKALKILKEQNIDLKVVFSGSDKGNLEYIKNKVNEYNLENYVIFAGFIPKEQCIALYKNALALVYASLLGPDNLPPLEAMGLECPAIVSDIEGHRIQLCDCCLFFNPLDENALANTIKSVIDKGYPQEMIKKGKVLAEKYSVKNYLDNTIKMFDDFTSVRECWG